MKLTVLGCSGSYPGPGTACSGYLVRTEKTAIWLDAGTGTMANLQRHADPGDVDAVILTHGHVDHYSDVLSFSVALQYYLGKPKVAVFGPPDVMELLDRRNEHVLTHPVGDGDEIEIGDVSVRFSSTVHSTPTVAVRLDGGGRSMAYSADTGPEWPLSSLGEGFDLALVEATFLQDYEGSSPHLSARQAGLTAKEAGAKRLLLTHLAPVTDPELAKAEARAAYGGDVDLAVENHSYEL